MKLCLVRHGEAVEEHVDPVRPLSPRGREQAATTADAFAVKRFAPARILCSPKARAKQTAEIVAATIAPDLALEETNDLKPDAEPDLIAPLLAEEDDDVLLVGHLPHLERLAGLLLAGDDRHSPIRFGAADGACLERKGAGAWKLLWQIISPIASTTPRAQG